MKTLLVGRHFLIREALRAILRELKSDAVVLEAVDGPEAMRLLTEEAGIGLVILDLDVLDRNGLPALGELRGCHPEVSVVVVSSSQDYDTIVRALDLGAHGFILKTAERQIMVRALELVFAGGVYFRRKSSRLKAARVPKPGARGTRRERRRSSSSSLD